MIGAAGPARTLECDAVLFDLDGVLADSIASVERHWRSWAEARGIDPALTLRTVHGRRAVESIRLLAPHLDVDAEVAGLTAREAADSSDVLAIPGAAALLAALPAGRWGIVTSGRYEVAEARLRVVGITPPAIMVTADDVSHGKPHPEGYLLGARRLGVDPSRCVVVEDAPIGIDAAHAAGMRALGVATTYPAAALAHAELVAPSLGTVRVTVDGAAIALSVA